MIVKSMNESAIYAIGHAFGYYDYGEEKGMVYAFFGQEPTAQYICAYVRGMLRGGFLHTTSERGEGYIALQAAQGKARLQDPLADRDGNAAQFEHEAPDAFRHGHQKGRKVAPRAHGQGKEALYLCWTCLRSGTVSGAGLYAQGFGYRLCRG